MTTQSTKTIDGTEYTRVFVPELEPGDKLATGEVVERIHRRDDWRTRVYLTDGQLWSFSSPTSTLLVEVPR